MDIVSLDDSGIPLFPFKSPSPSPNRSFRSPVFSFVINHFRYMLMNNFTQAFIAAFKSYLKLLPVIIIPVAGLVFLVTAAPYYAVSKGCEVFYPRERRKRKNLALLFAMVLASIITGFLLLISISLSAVFLLHTGEYLLICFIYGSFLIFSALAVR